MKKKKPFIKGRLKSITFASKGLLILVSSEHSVITQLLLFAISTVLGFCFSISSVEWMMQILCFGMILTAEGLNTAIEEIADFIHPEYHVKIGKIKDVAAGAVTFAAITALIILMIIYLPKFKTAIDLCLN